LESEKKVKVVTLTASSISRDNDEKEHCEWRTDGSIEAQGKALVQGQPDSGQAEEGNADPEDEEQGMGGLFRQAAGDGHPVLAKDCRQFMVLLAQKVRQPRVKQRDRQAQKDAAEFHHHGSTVKSRWPGFHQWNSLGVPPKDLAS